MKRSRDISSVHKGVSVSIILSVLTVMIVGVSIPNRAYGWGSDPTKCGWNCGHYFILNKAIQYLRRPEVNLLPIWPLEAYANDIRYGAYWADWPYAPVGLECKWCDLYFTTVYQTTCDSLHHFLTGGTIHEDTVTEFSIGDGRGLGAPQYASILYDLALKFWPVPGGPSVPDIRSLQFRDSGGFMCCLGDTKFGPFVVGGHPFLYDIIEDCAMTKCLIHYSYDPVKCLEPAIQKLYGFPTAEDAYGWPGFLGAQWDNNNCKWTDPVPSQSIRASLNYLGWAIHLIQDLSMPWHAANKTGLAHKDFEDAADSLILSNVFSNLPIRPESGNTYTNGDPVRPDFFHNDWSIEQFANESATLSLQVPVVGTNGPIEIDLDTSIKMAAGVIYKFFSEIETISPRCSDLIVQSISTNPTTPMVNQNVNVTITIKNQGSCDATPPTSFWVDFYGHRDSAPGYGDRGDGNIYDVITSLPAGATATLTGTIWYSYAGTFKMWAQVDSYRDVREANEYNNVFGPQTINVVVDDTPTGSIMINRGATYTNTPSVTLNLSCTDYGSGCYRMKFYQYDPRSNEWTPSEPYATTKAWTLKEGEGWQRVYVGYYDKSNNYSQYWDDICLDTLPPTGTISINSGAAYAYTPSVTLNLSCADSGSGCNMMRFSNDNVTWTVWEPWPWSHEKAWTLTNGDGTKTVYVQYQDKVGYISQTFSDTIVLSSGILSVTPADGLSSSGNQGGPFSPSSKSYTVTNPGASSINWTASKTQTWTTLSSTSGTLAAGASTTVTVSINSNANSLVVDFYSDTVTFTNTTNNNGNTTRPVNLTVNAGPGVLSVTPSDGLSSSGNQGGPFSPSSKSYTLTNPAGGSSINWTASKTQTWTTLSSASGTLAAGASTTVTVSINSNANSLAAGCHYDTVSFTDTTNGNVNSARPVSLTISWEATGSMGTARYYHTATLLQNGKVLMAGGMDYIGHCLTSGELYDPSTGAFSPTGSIGTARNDHTATLLPNGKVLIAGGSNPGYLITSAELYDPSTGSFSPTGSMGTNRYFHTATLLSNGKVLITGGFSNYPPYYLASAELYDPSTGSFSPTGSMGTNRYFHTATLLPNGKVLIAGGYPSLSSTELYDPITETFTPTGSMGTNRKQHTATLLPNGKVLIAGGVNATSSNVVILTSAELYDPIIGTFSPTGSMGTAREYPTATLLSNGKVLIVGGISNGGDYLPSAELYDPITGSFSPTESMMTARMSYTATLLPNGKVLIAGGTSRGGLYFASAELYQSTSCMSEADLMVLSITTNPATPASGQNVNVTITIKNQGGAAGSFAVDFYKNLGTLPLPSQGGDFDCTVSSLAAGATTTCVGTVNYAAAGTYNMWARVDTDQQVLESNENNNVFGPQSIVVATAPALSVTPVEGLTASGTQGGPFSPSSKSYTLQNTGGGSINWTASKGQTWTTLSSSSGTLAAGASTTVTVAINSNANSLVAVSYSDMVSFTNTTNNNGNTTRPVNLTVNALPGILSVTPSDGLTSSGNQGGPFSPSSKNYTLQNTGGTSINWTASKGQSWVTLSATGGTLGPAASTTVTVSINSNADGLTPGSYSDTVSFTNTTNNNGNTTRPVNLTVNALPGVLSVVPSESLTSSGTQGGPFSPSSKNYTLQNTGGTSINWTASKGQAWTTLSSSSGTLAAGASTTVTVSTNSNANGLVPMSYSDMVSFTNATNNLGNTTRPVNLTVNGLPGVLSVTPSDGLSSSGYQGGPFIPSNKNYTLQNTGGTLINWTASKAQTWVSLSSTSGTLAAGATTTVTVSINSNANGLTPGSYSDTVSFTNTTNNNGNTTRSVSLTVNTTGAVISPADGTIGTEISITGFGFGAKKGKVLIGSIPLTIIDWADGSIHCRLTKVLDPGVYDVTIQAKEPRGVAPIIEKNAFTVKAPEIVSVNPNSGSVGEQITISGNFFGSKKPKVYLGYMSNGKPTKKSCSVLSWSGDEIIFVVPKLPLGTYDVIATNSVSSDTLVGGFVIK